VLEGYQLTIHSHRLCRKFEKAFAWVIFIHTFFTMPAVTTVCKNIISMVNELFSSIESYKFVIFQNKFNFLTLSVNLSFGFSMLGDTFLMTYIGSEITANSELLLFSFYESSWDHIREVKHRKSLLIVMENLRRPIVINAYSFRLLLDSFLSVSCCLKELSLIINCVLFSRKSKWLST